jgi:hypothetical protein
VSAAKNESKRDAAQTGAEQTPKRRQEILADKTVRRNTEKEPSVWGRVPKDKK